MQPVDVERKDGEPGLLCRTEETYSRVARQTGAGVRAISISRSRIRFSVRSSP